MRYAIQYLLALSGAIGVARADSVLAGNTGVLPFTDTSPIVSVTNDWVGESIAEALRESLVSRGFPVIPRADIVIAYGDLHLRWNAWLTQASVLKLGQSLNTDAVIYGTYRFDAQGMVTLQASISDRARMRLGGPVEESGPVAELDRLEAHLAWRVLSMMTPSRPPDESQFRSLRPPVRPSAEESFIRGLLTSGDQREKFYQQAARADARFARPALELGKIELARKNDKAAADWFLKVPAGDMHYAEASFYFGVAKFHQADYAAAKAAFERITRALPVAEVFNNLGAAESRRNELHAIASFREALELNPSHPDYHFNLGYALFKSGQFDAAADRFRAVLERDPSDQAAIVLLGRSIKGDGLRKGATADARFQTAERFKETYEEPLYHAPATAERSAPIGTEGAVN